MARGKFITLEGGEGAGKSTQAALLASALEGAGLEVHKTREPGGSPGAEQVRGLLVEGDADRWDPMTEALLHFAARRDHLVRTIAPALQRGAWVVSDRFADSTMAYQGCAGGLGADVVNDLYRLAVGDTKPDLTLILDLPVAEGLARAAGRGTGEDRYERMDGEFHEKLRAAFLDIAKRAPERCVVIDALGGVEDVAEKIRAAVAAKLGLDL